MLTAGKLLVAEVLDQAAHERAAGHEAFDDLRRDTLLSQCRRAARLRRLQDVLIVLPRYW
jgi:hypothetical protein